LTAVAISAIIASAAMMIFLIFVNLDCAKRRTGWLR